MGGTYLPGELKVIGGSIPSGNIGKVKGAESRFNEHEMVLAKESSTEVRLRRLKVLRYYL
jgi:hypothetical protein